MVWCIHIAPNPTSKTPCYLRGAGQSRAQYVLGSAQQGAATLHAARLRQRVPLPNFAFDLPVRLARHATTALGLHHLRVVFIHRAMVALGTGYMRSPFSSTLSDAFRDILPDAICAPCVQTSSNVYVLRAP